MEPRTRARITGTGSHVPRRRLTNADLERMVETSDEWISARTGIKERRLAAPDEATSDMCVGALEKALTMSGTEPDEVEALIVGTVTPDYRLPATACLVQERLGFKNAVAYDIVAACTGFINGMAISRCYIESGVHRKIAIVGAEKLSAIVNYEDRKTCVLFGDGAGAAILEADYTGHGVLSTFMKSDGSMSEWLWIPAGGVAQPVGRDFAFDNSDKISMNGSEVFRVAVRQMCNAALNAIEQASLDPNDIDLIVPHQANIRIIEALAKRLKVSMDKVIVNIEKYGNTSAASVPVALDEAHRDGRLKRGDHILMVAFGGGMIWGAAVVRW